MIENINELIDDIVSEVSFRTDSGLVDFRKADHIYILSEVLTEMGLGGVKDELISALMEADEDKPTDEAEDDKYSHKAYGYYVKKGDEEKEGAQVFTKQDGRYVPSSPEEYEKAAAEQGEKGAESSDADKAGDGEGSEDGGVQQAQPEKGAALDPNTKGGAAWNQNLPDGDPAKIKKDKPKDDMNKVSDNGYVGKKNKKLKNTFPLQSEEYNKELGLSDTEFEDKNKKSANPVPPSPVKLDGIVKNPKFPKRYIKVLERMLNSRATNETAKWNHFSDIAGGAGQISAQAGELMTMMGSTMNDEEWNSFKNTILEYETELISSHSNLKNPTTRIIDKSWVVAADKSRRVILNRLKKRYGDGVEIVASAWDNKNEVEALGMENYKENKGFSTDVYFRIKTEDGNEILDEVSLKKSEKVNFLNSGAGKFEEWDDNLPDEINQSVYGKNQRKRNNSFIKNNKEDVDRFLASPEAEPVLAEMKRKGLTFEQALEGNSRSKQKILWMCIVEMAKDGNQNAKITEDGANEAHKQFQEKAINAIATNEKMKEGMLQTIRDEFPLKSVSEGEETMAIGDMSLDRETMKEIFGTSDYEQIKERLVAKEGPPPFLGYSVEAGGDVIPIAEVAVREDGVGYGGVIKFEMKLDKRFADRLKSATKSVYG